MAAHRRGTPFIRYTLPALLGGKPPKPPPGEQGGKGKPRPVTTLALGEESGGSHPGITTTTMALGEEGSGS